MGKGSFERIDGVRGDTATGAPHTVDLRVTGQCQLRCDWCWGPEHSRKGGVTPAQWQKTLGYLAARGTKQVVFSGGEPLLSKSLRPGIEAAKSNGLNVTLSTNGILLEKNRDILASVDDLGIPIDGSNPSTNNEMRRWSDRHNGWAKAIGAIRLAQEMRQAGESSVAVTARTVIARPNVNDVPNIPGALKENGVDLANLRMKLYQVEPFGPHYEHINFDGDWAITAEEAQAAAYKTRENAPDANITLQLYGGTVGRYFLIDPDGYATGTDEDKNGVPIEVAYGNIVNEFDSTLDAYMRHQEGLAQS
ncbi:MAG: radical SAM protein [Candidatus Saccharibacteria bacterium]